MIVTFSLYEYLSLPTTDDIATFHSEWIPDFVSITKLSAPNNISVRQIYVKENCEAVGFEAGGEKPSNGHHPCLQLDADERVHSDVVALGTVGVSVHSPVSSVNEAGVGVAESAGGVVLVVLGAGIFQPVTMALSCQAFQGGGQEGIKVTSVHHRNTNRVELHPPLTLVELQVLQQELLADVAEPGVVSL